MDLTSDRSHSLSPETLAYLNQVNTPIEVFVAFASSNKKIEAENVMNDIRSILEEFSYQSHKGNKPLITAQFIDTYKENNKMQELVAQYGISRGNTILVTCGDRFREITDQELYSFKKGHRAAFKGEEVFLSAILDVSSDKAKKVYFTVGHGELMIDDVEPQFGLTQFKQFLVKRNIILKELDLSTNEPVPEDADLVIIPSPQGAFLPFEVEKLRKYTDINNGRVIIFIEPGRKHGLEELMFDWGIVSDDMVVVDPTGEDYRPATEDFIVRRFAPHQITQFLIDYEMTLLTGLHRPVRQDPGSPDDSSRIITPILTSSPTSWAERNYRTEETYTFNPQVDLQGPIPIGIVSEKNAGNHIGINIPGGRLVVFGNSKYISNHRFLVYGNQLLMANTINWCLDRNNLLSIPPRRIKQHQLVITNQEFGKIIAYFSVIPFTFLSIGFAMYFIRKN